MISTQSAIGKARRDLTLAAIVRWLLLAAAGVVLFAQPWLSATGVAPITVLFVIGALSMVLMFYSLRGSRIAADSTSLIATGQFDLAEQNIAEALKSFSIFRTSKLMSLHHLAVLRHAQSRWQESAMLCRALLHQRLGALTGLDRSSRLMLAESLLEMGDLRGVHENLDQLYDQRLSLRDALNLMSVQLDYLARVKQWDKMFAGLMRKVEMAELLPAFQSARTQAFLSLAAKNLGKLDWFEWLRKRAELLADVQKLCIDRPMLKELWL